MNDIQLLRAFLVPFMQMAALLYTSFTTIRYSLSFLAFCTIRYTISYAHYKPFVQFILFFGFYYSFKMLNLRIRKPTPFKIFKITHRKDEKPHLTFTLKLIYVAVCMVLTRGWQGKWARAFSIRPVHWY